MARKVINTTHSANRYDILSQTPKNFSIDNYFIKELQDKVDADWEYRPNRVDIEYEDSWGNQTYSPIEVVMQSARSEKGTEIADDYRNIVFKRVLERRFVIGSRFRFGVFDPEVGESSVSEEDKNVWIATNTDSVKMTSSMIITRCNGALGSTYQNAQGVSQYHYEPVILKRDLSSAGFTYNDVAVSQESKIEVIAQANDYTRNYFINQRFIIGNNRTYRIQAINDFASNATFNPSAGGLIKIYLEITEKSQYDNFVDRIAYQDGQTVVIKDSDTVENTYSIKFTTPETIPANLTKTAVVFTPVVIKSDGTVDTTKNVALSASLENLPSSVAVSNYVSIVNNNNVYTLTQVRSYFRGNLVLEWTIMEGETSIGESVVFEMTVQD